MKTWIAVDWGTTNLRVWVMHGTEVSATLTSEAGMARVASGGFEAALLNLVEAYLPENASVDVICCGMVGAAQGWRESAYAAVPCAPSDPASAVGVVTQDQRLDVRILPGLKQVAPCDVMRGEETQIAGVLREVPDFEGLICLPGTHSKWAFVRNERVIEFRTFMTGELFSLLTEYSVLQHSTGPHWDEDGFEEGLATGLDQRLGVSADLFAVRADMLVAGRNKAFLTAKLSGLLLGSELAGMRKLWSVQQVHLVGEERLADLYCRALDKIGIAVRQHDAMETTLSGLVSAWKNLTESEG